MSERYITLDFDPVIEGADVPEGTYKVQVSDANLKTASTGNPMVELKMEIVEDPSHNGRKLFDNITLTAKAAWKLKQVMQAMGLTFKGKELNLDDWLNRTMWVDVVIETDSGRSRPNKYRRA